jgi:uncharacterized protein (DUF362 family)
MKQIILILTAISIVVLLTACQAPTKETGAFKQAVSSDTGSGSEILKEGNKEEEMKEKESNVPYDSVFPEHKPYGNGVGVMPGRVVWEHNKDSVEWDGEGYWWETKHFNEDVILNMVRGSIINLGGKKTVEESWTSLFRYNNEARGKSGGYVRGEKIAIKANMNGSYSAGKTQDSYTNPVLLRTLLISLVKDAGVEPSDITVFDTCRVFPDYMIKMCTSDVLKGVRFQYSDPTGANDVTADTSAPVVWSQKFRGETSYLPTCVTEAKYMISLANLKGHTYGITLSAKNHFGSIINSSRISPPEAASIHQFLSNHKMNSYTVLVDLLANYQLGEKTMLYMLDGLICAPSEAVSITDENSRWEQTPFNNDYTSSVFVSQDPVALDSVGADFLINEPAVTKRNSTLKDNPTVENYLHEAGLAANAPSGTVYYNGNGKVVKNLGVHEHWNNSTEKLYSRNLGKDEGIELVYLNPEK